jgi:hypothetical protein
MEPDPKVAKFLAENKGQRQPPTGELIPRHKEEIRFIREATLCTVTTGVNPAQLTHVKKWLRQLPGNPHHLKDDGDHNAFIHQDMKTLAKRGLIIAKGENRNAVFYLDPVAIDEAMKATTDAKKRAAYKTNIERWTTLPHRKGY